MRPNPLNPAPFLMLFLVAAASWAAWLGWDQHRDVHPDGSVAGPYEAWQVVGLVLTLLVPVYWAASRRHVVGAVFGTTAGVTTAAFYDWSDDSSGLFVIGVGLVMTACLLATSALSAVVVVRRGEGGFRGDRPGSPRP
ncbi:MULTISPECIES: hypothetical protein [unclassified Streptomyces]|uniref:hypothetical protein n=1 Tax=unclassified Streptomyces TaxID=2593676 RepID=UPI002E2EF244|nr:MULTISPECIES: hypothetical protein [unclassified Streptomyces]WUC69000.1 hypothetical protein OG861_32605 [Streptomyces sp. NBC_00539]